MVSGYGELVYQFGLATRDEADFIIDKTKEAVKYIQNGDFEKAFAVSSKNIPIIICILCTYRQTDK